MRSQTFKLSNGNDPDSRTDPVLINSLAPDWTVQETYRWGTTTHSNSVAHSYLSDGTPPSGKVPYVH